MSTGSRRAQVQHSLGLILDVLQSTMAFAAAATLALDNFGLIDLPWFRRNLLDIVFIAVCTLVIASVLERRSTLESFHAETNRRLGEVESRIAQIRNGLSGFLSGDLFLRDRSQYEPLEKRVRHAKEVYAIGRSLIGFVGIYQDAIQLEADRGCVFRFVLISDPYMYQDGPTLSDEREWAIAKLFALQERFPGKIEVRLSKSVLTSSIVAIDYKTEHGLIQVELYPSVKGLSPKPHFDLMPSREPKWYEYYRRQVELLWEGSYPSEQGSERS